MHLLAAKIVEIVKILVISQQLAIRIVIILVLEIETMAMVVITTTATIITTAIIEIMVSMVHLVNAPNQISWKIII